MKKFQDKIIRQRKVTSTDEVLSGNDLDTNDKVNTEQEKIRKFILASISCSELSIELLVDQVARHLSLSRSKAVEQILFLQREKKLILAEKRPHKSFGSYLFSYHSNWFWLTLTASLISALTVSMISGESLYLRYFFGSLLILFIPGYALVELLYAKRTSRKDEDIYSLKIALSVGLSLVILASVALVLNYTVLGITIGPLIAILLTITVVFLVLASIRKYDRYNLDLLALEKEGRTDSVE